MAEPMRLYRVTVTVVREDDPTYDTVAEATVFHTHAVTAIHKAARGAASMVTPPVTTQQEEN